MYLIEKLYSRDINSASRYQGKLHWGVEERSNIWQVNMILWGQGEEKRAFQTERQQSVPGKKHLGEYKHSRLFSVAEM